MDTLTKNELETVTLDAITFYDLLLGASVAMDKAKGATDNLASVYLSVTGDGLAHAYASDRYRLIVGDLECDGTLEECQLRSNDVKNILATLKGNKLAREVTLTRAGDTLSLAIGSTSLNILLGGGKFPPYAHLFELEPKPVGSIMLNPSYLASFEKVPSSEGGNVFTFYGETKPVGVTINHKRIKWNALLMPMRKI